jgi:SIR2-like domain
MASSSDDLDGHLHRVLRALTNGRLVPFLGAGANLCDRPPGSPWSAGQLDHLPSGSELAGYLAEKFKVEEKFKAEEKKNLALVAQHVELLNGATDLYDELRELFDANYAIPSLHRLLASLPAARRSRGLPKTSDVNRRRLLYVTTNYDDLLERALQEAGEEFHIFVYEANGDHMGTFLHQDTAGNVTRVERPNEYPNIQADEHPVILKFHGAVDRKHADQDSFVITENHYIEYLTRTDAGTLIPTPLPAMLQNSHLLFLGYGLRDWNLRVILHRLWKKRKLTCPSWAIQRDSEPLDRAFWKERGVELIQLELGEYVKLLGDGVRNWPGGAT